MNPVLVHGDLHRPGLIFNRPVVISNHTNPLVSSLRTTVLNSANTSGTQTWSGDISGNGGFIRATGGETVLSGTNTYTGGTTVQAGSTLRTTSSAVLPDSGDVFLFNGLPGSNLFLDFSGTDTIARLLVDNTPLTPGLYNSGNLSLITGSGELNVTASGASPGVVPEPGTLVLAMMAMFAFGGARRRRG